jgi:hypothetical protein
MKITKSVSEEMNEALAQYMAAVSTQDFAEVSKHMHSNVLFRFSDHEDTTLEQIKEYHETFWSTIKDGKFWATDVEWLYADSKMFVCSYRVNFSGYLDGVYAEGSEGTVDIFIKDGTTGKWKLVLTQCAEEYRP